MKELTTGTLMDLFTKCLIHAVEIFGDCAGDDYDHFMLTLSKAKFSENSSYILAALLTMTEDDLAYACQEISEFLKSDSNTPKEQIDKAITASKYIMECNIRDDEQFLTPKEMAECISENFSVKCSPQIINRVLIDLGYQIKDPAIRYAPTGKAYKEKVYQYETVSKHSTLKWSTVLVPKILGEM